MSRRGRRGFREERRHAIVCSYLSFRDPRLNQVFRLPLVHIRIKLGSKSVRTNALVDSGATTSFVPLDFIRMLELEPAPEWEKQKVVGAGGAFEAYRLKVDSIEVLKGMNAFCELKDQTIFVPVDAEAIPYAILGRDSVFCKHDVTYRELKKQLVFRKSKH